METTYLRQDGHRKAHKHAKEEFDPHGTVTDEVAREAGTDTNDQTHEQLNDVHADHEQ